MGSHPPKWFRLLRTLIVQYSTLLILIVAVLQYHGPFPAMRTPRIERLGNRQPKQALAATFGVVLVAVVTSSCSLVATLPVSIDFGLLPSHLPAARSLDTCLKASVNDVFTAFERSCQSQIYEVAEPNPCQCRVQQQHCKRNSQDK